MLITWTLFLQILIVLVLIFILFFKEGRQAFMNGAKKLISICTSKRFITLMIATWFVYREIAIDPNWLLLAGFYIGIDTAHNNGIFQAFSEYLKNRKGK